MDKLSGWFWHERLDACGIMSFKNTPAIISVELVIPLSS